jgi:hypothetical protein
VLVPPGRFGVGTNIDTNKFSGFRYTLPNVGECVTS